jgi:signal peptidase I
MTTQVRGGWLRALWAGLLSLCQPGLGHVYVGKWRFGIVLYLIGVGGMILLAAITRIAAPTPVAVAAFMAVMVASGLFLLGSAIDAGRRVKRFGVAGPRPWYASTWIAAVMAVGLSVGWRYVVPFGWEPFSIASASTMPGLIPSDYVFIDVRQPGSMPTQGDVIVFRTRPFRDTTTDYIKRVVGLPGDVVQLREGILYLNGTPVMRQSMGTFTASGRLADRSYRRYRETLPNGRSFEVLLQNEGDALENTLPARVPPSHVFVLGDSRDDSIDSRMHSVGFVPQADIEGRAYTIYWSGDLSRLLRRIE